MMALSARQWDRLIGAFAVLTLVIAFFGGIWRGEAEDTPHLPIALPHAQRFVALSPGDYAGYTRESTGDVLVGYVAVGEASGYGGPMKVAVGVDPQGKILGVDVVVSREDSGYLAEVLRSRLPGSLLGKAPGDSFRLGSDLDAVTGATFTARAIAEASRQAARRVATKELNQTFPEDQPKGIEFGIPEITLLLLYAVGFVGHQSKFRLVKKARWVTLLVGLIVLGFVYNRLLTLAQIDAFLLGFWPNWQQNLYWYMLIGGILFVFTVDNKNPYCDWFCPFGAAQECVGLVGRARQWTPRRGRRALIWLQRGIAWGAIMIALLYRNPGLSSYEIYNSLFRFVTNNWQFEALVIFLLLSLVIKRPWCNFACPVRPVTDFIRMLREWFAELAEKRAQRVSGQGS